VGPGEGSIALLPHVRRVAIVVHAIVPGDPRVRRQSDALADAGYEADIFCLRQEGQPAEEVDGRVRVIRLPIDRGLVGFVHHIAEYVAFTAMATLRLAREHRRRRYDLVQVATVPDFLTVAALPQKLAGVPLLLDLHEDMPEFFRDRFRSLLLRPLVPVVGAVARGAAAVADEIITVHEPLRRLSIARGVEQDRIGVVMNSADARLFDPSRHERRSFMADGTLRLIHHSNLQRIYGLDVAVEGLACVRPDLPWSLDVYGDGPWRPHIEAAIARTGTAERVTLHGRVPMDDLPGLLAGSDIGLVPSLAEPYLEYSLSTKLLEYAAMGVPTIASDLATFRHHFTDAAIHFVPGSDPAAIGRAVEARAADPAGTLAMGEEMRRQAAAYDWEVQKARYLEIVGRMCASAGPAV
jgi:glycosyltransferase involved in cell wall biosynthesis